ncbi:hypothetical protein [Desulfobacter sp.]|uniref:hypothetical protein n=1 Tax=Desulfobacter sp. TaxID=2294 RepID=UPI000E9BFE01|nr:hypothetical protein [Desulfobacter sp.]HBT88768.1 hypothetical protein [Desulfobacter sp.]
MKNASTTQHTPAYQTTPLHQYSTVQLHPVQTTYPVQTYPAKSAASAATLSKTASAGIFGFIVVSTGTMGFNLNKVSAGEMTMAQATGDSVVKGAIGGTAAACATAAATGLTNGGVAGLAVTLAAATGISYMINRIIS